MDACKQDFLRIVDQHQGIIHCLCQLYYKDADDQKDTRQDIILQLWKAFPSFRGEATLSTWIYKVSLNTILSKVRKEQRRPQQVNLDLSTENLPPMLTADDDLQLLRLIIASLKDVDKAIVVLHLEGYGNKEIAQLLALTPTNVSTRMNRIKSALRSKYKMLSYELR